MAYNYITNIDSPNFTPAAQARAVFGYDRVIEGITLHWWGDPNQNPQFESVANYLSRQGGNSSAHYVATGTGRKVACIVSPLDVAWHSGSAWGNARTIGIELDPRARAEDVDVAAELVADIRSAFGDVPIYWHSLFQATACPGAYRDQGLLDKIDELSYKKVSHADWGAVTDLQPKTPIVAPPPATTPTTTPSKTLYKVFKDGKQIGAYSTESNAYRAYDSLGATRITHGTRDVTVELVAKYKTSSPTTNGSDGEPLIDTGLPITEKIDYGKENNTLLKTILELLTALVNKITSVFK